MAKRLTDAKKKSIIADYAILGTYSATARKHKVSVDTVKRTVLADPETHDIVNKKRDENTLDMLAYMDSKSGEAQSFIDACMTALLEPERMNKAKLSEITTAMGTVIDKFTNIGQLNENALSKLDKIIEGLDDAAKS